MEQENGRLAAKVVAAHGGRVTFAEYDELMTREKYFTPLEWATGWGDWALWKANNDKLCAFAAVKMRLLRQTKTGYEALSIFEFA